MPLLDSFLFEGYRVNVWVAFRTDGITGSGTLNDPYDGSDPDVFDELMNGFPDLVTETTGVRVNLGPGIFETRGFADSQPTAGWQPVARMKIVGSGVDVTTLKLVSNASDDEQCFAVAHKNDIAAGAVRIKGSHSRIRRLKVINWGSRSAEKQCHVISAIIGDPLASTPSVFDAMIDECIVISPGEDTLGPITLLNIGGKDDVHVQPEAFGESAVIRNCFINGAPGTGGPSAVEIRAPCAGLCHGPI